MMEFETHVTVDPSSNVDSLRKWASQNRIKFTHIVLARGETTSQPMLTFHGGGDLEAQLIRAEEISSQIAALGCVVTRVKVEVGLDNSLVPQSSSEAVGLPPENYFEFHVKLKLRADVNHVGLLALAKHHQAHLSNNALRLRSDGMEERFITKRCSFVSRADAVEQFDRMLDDIYRGGGDVLEIEKEFVVYDSNLSVDAGWISSEG